MNVRRVSMASQPKIKMRRYRRLAPPSCRGRRGVPCGPDSFWEHGMTRFDGQVAIVTGAARGLGRAHALGLAARGAKVLVSDLGEAGAPSQATQSVAAEIAASGGTALANEADVADPAAAHAAVRQALDAWGRVDILVNNAGILRDKSFANMDPEDFERVINVHLLGT